MKTPKLIQKIIEQYNEKQYTKPKYRIYDLLVATINYPTAKGYLVIRDFAICISAKSSNIFHPSLQPLNTDGLPRYYVLTNLHYFQVALPEFMQKHNLTPNSKLSLKQIDDIEKELNKNQEYNIRFN